MTTGLCLVAGEVTTSAVVDVSKIARGVIREIGYTSSDMGFDAETCSVIVALGHQSPDIAMGVDKGGAGDQGLMFGYACDETPELMPMPIQLAHQLMARLAEMRQSGGIDWLRPDAKSQVTIQYVDGRPARVEAVVISTQHAETVGEGTIRKTIVEELVKKVIPARFLDEGTHYYVNPTGRFVVGGPKGDCGLTGRKIIVDSYGGMGRHGGGAFSGKDPSKVDRSAAYAARYVAKNVVAAGLAARCEVQVAYAIGVDEPVSVLVDTFDTGRLDDERLSAIIRAHFDLRPRAIIQMLDLLRPIYQETARHGHFGRSGDGFTWERTDRAEALRREAGVS